MCDLKKKKIKEIIFFSETLVGPFTVHYSKSYIKILPEPSRGRTHRSAWGMRNEAELKDESVFWQEVTPFSQYQCTSICLTKMVLWMLKCFGQLTCIWIKQITQNTF